MSAILVDRPLVVQLPVLHSFRVLLDLPARLRGIQMVGVAVDASRVKSTHFPALRRPVSRGLRGAKEVGRATESDR